MKYNTATIQRDGAGEKPIVLLALSVLGYTLSVLTLLYATASLVMIIKSQNDIAMSIVALSGLSGTILGALLSVSCFWAHRVLQTLERIAEHIK